MQFLAHGHYLLEQACQFDLVSTAIFTPVNTIPKQRFGKSVFLGYNVNVFMGPYRR